MALRVAAARAAVAPAAPIGFAPIRRGDADGTLDAHQKSSGSSPGWETPWLRVQIPALELTPHPLPQRQGDSRIHNDHYNSAVYNRSGPVGPDLEMTTTHWGPERASAR